MSIILINLFKIDDETFFFKAWKEVDAFMQKQEGFIRTTLHKNLGIAPFNTYNYVNYAVWESVAHFQKAILDFEFQKLVAPIRPYAVPGLYEVIYEEDL